MRKQPRNILLLVDPCSINIIPLLRRRRRLFRRTFRPSSFRNRLSQDSQRDQCARISPAGRFIHVIFNKETLAPVKEAWARVCDVWMHARGAAHGSNFRTRTVRRSLFLYKVRAFFRNCKPAHFCFSDQNSKSTQRKIANVSSKSIRTSPRDFGRQSRAIQGRIDPSLPQTESNFRFEKADQLQKKRNENPGVVLFN